ncbi:hypothetical protein [Cohaesibacter intestini]|uniref:hypothetical protein n=1 Tax=Cohaesibacter intestini TaxID=2211145 RepID=UPI000DE8EA7C|nr:hypothetical protein [Cohaesibacter intestini]
MQNWTKPLFGVLLLTASSLPAMAGFDEDVDKAYAPYRVALFKSNQNDAEATKMAIGKFLKIWDGTILTSYTTAPARYEGEANWSKTLTDIKAIAVKADAATKEGKVAEAHEILEAIRDELDGLRDRNGIRVFSSYINAYHSEMEHLLNVKLSKESWSPKLAGDIHEQLGVLAYLAKDITAHVPVAYQDQDAFKALLNGLHQSINGLRAALDDNDPMAVAKAIKSLKPAYAKLFLKFG